MSGLSPAYLEFTELLGHVPKMWRSLLDQRLRPFGFSQATWQVLLKVSRASGPLLQTELAARIGIEPASLVRLLDVLENEGWVRRQPDPDDRRAKRVALTDKAVPVCRELQAVSDQLKAELLGAIDPAQLATCIAVMRQIAVAGDGVVHGS